MDQWSPGLKRFKETSDSAQKLDCQNNDFIKMRLPNQRVGQNRAFDKKRVGQKSTFDKTLLPTKPVLPVYSPGRARSIVVVAIL